MRNVNTQRVLAAAVAATLGVVVVGQTASAATYTWASASLGGRWDANAAPGWVEDGGVFPGIYPNAAGDVANLNLDFTANVVIRTDGGGTPVVGVLNWGDSTLSPGTRNTVGIGTNNDDPALTFNNNGLGAQINTIAGLGSTTAVGNIRSKIVLQDDLIVTLGGTTLNDSNATLNGTISETGGPRNLIKRGGGYLTLGGGTGTGSTYTGLTILEYGRIQISGAVGRIAIPGNVQIKMTNDKGRLQNTAADVIADSSNIEFLATSAEWSLGGGQETVGSLTSAPGYGIVHVGTVLGLAATSGTYSYGGVIGDGSAIATLNKTGGSTQTLAGTAANNISTSVSVTGGILQLNKTAGVNALSGTISLGNGSGSGTIRLLAADQIADASSLTLNGGTFDANGFSESAGALASSGNSVIDFGAGASNLTYASAGTIAGTLQLLNWTEGSDHLVFNDASNVGSQLGNFQFLIGGTSYGASLSNNEVVPLVPEPASLSLLALGGLALLRRRRA